MLAGVLKLVKNGTFKTDLDVDMYYPHWKCSGRILNSEQQEAAVSTVTMFGPSTVGRGEIKMHISKLYSL